MKARALTLRAVALLAAGAAGVHQLRYALSYGDDAGRALAVQGHAYLDLVLPFVAALGLVALATMLRAPLPSENGRVSLRRAWACAFVALVVAYCAQELLEGLLANGHPAGFVGVFGGGGWFAVPIAAVVALLVALGMRGAPLAAGTGALRVGPVSRAAAVARPFAALVVGGVPRAASARGPPLLPAV